MDDYLALPLKLRDGFLRRCDFEESIRQSVALIIASRKGMIRFSPDYGSDLWEKEYTDLYVAHKSDVQSSLRNAIGQFEPRLNNLGVALLRGKSSSDSIAETVSVRVTGVFKDGDEEKKFEATFALTDQATR